MNTPWVGLNSGWTFNGGSDAQTFQAVSPTTAEPTANYGFFLWFDYPGAIDGQPVAGGVYKVEWPGDLDVTDYQFIFNRPA